MRIFWILTVGWEYFCGYWSSALNYSCWRWRWSQHFCRLQLQNRILSTPDFKSKKSFWIIVSTQPCLMTIMIVEQVLLTLLTLFYLWFFGMWMWVWMQIMVVLTTLMVLYYLCHWWCCHEEGTWIWCQAFLLVIIMIRLVVMMMPIIISVVLCEEMMILP